MECESMLFVKNHIPYLWDLSNSFSDSFTDFYSCEGFHQVIYQKEWSIKLRVDNAGWHETLNILHVSRCEMLHFVTSYMKQNKSRKQTLESAQYGMEISFTGACPVSCKAMKWSVYRWYRKSLYILMVWVWTAYSKPFPSFEQLCYPSCFVTDKYPLGYCLQ